MHPEMARILAAQYQDELTSRAARWHTAASAREHRRHVPHPHLPHYRVHWSRATLSPVGAAGRPERSWVIVISATRGI